MAKLAREVASARAPSFVETQASVLLDLVRGLAALLVLGEHWRNLFFVDYPQLPAHKLLWALPYVLTGAGHQAVVIFFVLSGYLISGSIFRALKRDQWSWASYMTHRVVRLWVVLLPGLLLCAAFDTLGLHLHRAPLVYAGLGLNPVVEGQNLRVPIPPLTEERRRDLAKLASRYAEQQRIAVRNVRREANDDLKKAEKDGAISQDELKRMSDEVQKLTDEAVKRVDEALKTKEHEIMQV